MRLASQLLAMVLVVWGSLAFAAEPQDKSDQIRFKDETTLAVHVVRVTNDSICYTLPGESKEHAVAKAKVAELRYADGRVERMAPANKEAKPERTWQDVQVTKNPADVEGMLLVEKYDVTLSPGRLMQRAKPAELERGATIQLQQKALEKRCTHLLIQQVEFQTSYGEPPAVRIVAEGYRELKGYRR